MPEKSEQLALGIDFGGTSVKFGVCAGAEMVAAGEPIDTTAFYDRDPDDLIDAIAKRASELADAHPGIVAIGVGLPGLVDSQRGHVFEITNVPGWIDISFRDKLAEATGMSVAIDNDANCMAYAEWRHGAGVGFDDLVAITLGTGVGGALVIDGKLHRGAQFCAGEVGQTSIDHQAPRDAIGMPGVIEKFVGNREIAARAVEKFAAAGVEKSLAECSPKALAELAREGEEIALAVWSETAGMLAVALANAVWILNPQAIVIGGGVASAGKLLFDPLQAELKSMLSPVLAENIKVLPAIFGNEAGIIGSAALARESVGKSGEGG